ncbi:MAG: hydroxyacid dehydrogenase [Caldilineaceae bacterium]|nr:hydroxyacid dehydrogenase [Caldilineaceae bacterium]
MSPATSSAMRGGAKPHVLFAFSQQVWDGYADPVELARLERFASWQWLPCDGGGRSTFARAAEDPESSAAIRAQIGAADALVVCHGAPYIGASILDAAPRLRLLGELEGDRFAGRMDLEAAWARHIRTVDVTNGSSYPVAEWALGLILLSMRNAGAHFRRIIAGDTTRDPDLRAQMPGRLRGKRVGLIGCGHMGRLLLKLLRPFQVELWVHDPYLPREMAEALGFLQTTLDNVLSQCDVVVCLVPLTPGTQGLLGARELNLIQPGAVFVNVSRGAVVDSAALIARLARNDIIAGLDVFDPEPIPPDSPILELPNVFLSPHVGAHTGDAYRPFMALMVDELERFFHGHETHFDLTPRSLANRSGAAAIGEVKSNG